jgi:branched-chain amino acid aminotransferase
VDCIISSDYDRAAPKGVGAVKVAGNYAADLLPNYTHKQQGYPITLYLDAKTNSYVEEFSTSNFIGLCKSTKTFLTPLSDSVLPSITNKSLMTIAHSLMGWAVEQRPIHVTELEKMDEVVACGTAVVVTPIAKIVHGDRTFTFESSNDVTMELYKRVRLIQNGEVDDTFGWNYQVF